MSSEKLEGPTRKKSRSNTRQVEALVESMEANTDLALGRFAGPMGKQKNVRLWDEVALKLSDMGPAKTGIQCKTSWRDLRKKVREKNATIRQARVGTGNRLPIPELTEIERKVLSIIGTDSSEGVGAAESIVDVGELAVVQDGIYDLDNDEDVITAADVENVPPPLPPTTPAAVTATPVRTQQSRTSYADAEDIAKNFACAQVTNNAILSDIANSLKNLVEYKSEKLKLEKEKVEIKKQMMLLKKKELEMLFPDAQE